MDCSVLNLVDPSFGAWLSFIPTDDIGNLYQWMLGNKIRIHPNGTSQSKPWGQKEFALLDSDNNLLTFGQSL